MTKRSRQRYSAYYAPLGDSRGVTLVEYALATALFVIAILVVVNGLETQVKDRVEETPKIYETWYICDPNATNAEYECP